MITISMVGDSRPGTGTRTTLTVVTVPGRIKAPGGIETVPGVTWTADTYQQDRRLTRVSPGTTGKTPPIPWNGPRWRSGLIIKVNYVITSRFSLTQTPEIAYSAYTLSVSGNTSGQPPQADYNPDYSLYCSLYFVCVCNQSVFEKLHRYIHCAVNSCWQGIIKQDQRSYLPPPLP